MELWKTLLGEARLLGLWRALWKTLLGEARLLGLWRAGLDARVLPGLYLWSCRWRLCQGGWGAEGTCWELLHPCRSRDFYHTCYCLSGLSIAQHFGSGAMLHDVVLGVPENALVRWDVVGEEGLPPLLRRAPRMELAGGQSSLLGPPELTAWVSRMDGLASSPSPHPLCAGHSPLVSTWPANSRF